MSLSSEVSIIEGLFEFLATTIMQSLWILLEEVTREVSFPRENIYLIYCIN